MSDTFVDLAGRPSPHSNLHLTGPEFQRFLESLPAAAYTCDPAGLITFYNRRAAAIWGREPKLNDPADRFCGSVRLHGIDGTPIPHASCWMALALREGRDYTSQEIVVERPDGQRIVALAHASPIRDAQGTLLGAVNVVVDVRDRRQGEEIRARLAAIVESSDDAIVGKTLDGRITSWNAGAERIFGYPANQAIGRFITLIVPEERFEEERAILDRLARGERIAHFETVRRREDGKVIHISQVSSPIRDAEGNVVGASMVARDVTERKQAERNLLSVRNELATQLGDMRRLQEMSVRLSTSLELQPILEETLRTAVTIEGADRGLLSLVHPENGTMEIGASLGFDEAFLSVTSIALESAGTCSQRGERNVIEDTETDAEFAPYRESARRAGFRAVHSTPLVTRSGKLVGVLSTHFQDPRRPSEREMNLIDLCARQAAAFIENARLYGQLREADRRKDEFLAILAHELRNPLAPIRNALGLLELDGDNPITRRETHAMMERQVNQMVRLVDDLMDASRITRNKLVLRKDQVELAAVVGSAIESTRPWIEACGHELVVKLPRQPIYLDADLTRLAQVFSNLLNNAAKYTERGGTIVIEAEPRDREVVVAVRDTGVGIPADMLPNVFEMFTQVDHSLERAEGGLGIGLSLVRGLVQLHGGSVEARSLGVGQGSEFVVRLPVLTGGRPRDLGGATGAAPARTRSCRILVVDDNHDSATSLGLMLELLGHELRVEHDGLAAVGATVEFRPEIVFLDIGLPKLNGYDVARRIRSEPFGESVFLVAVTGWGQEEDKRRAAEAGFNHHMVKPLDTVALRELLVVLGRKLASGAADGRGNGPVQDPGGHRTA